MTDDYSRGMIIGYLDSYHDLDIYQPEAKLDIDNALRSAPIDPDGLKAILIRHGLQLSLREAAMVVPGAEEYYIGSYEQAIDKIVSYLSGDLFGENKKQLKTLGNLNNLMINDYYHPFRNLGGVRLEVARKLKKYDELSAEMVRQSMDPSRVQTIMNMTSDNYYPSYDVSVAVEDPHRQVNYINRRHHGNDHFVQSDISNNVGRWDVWTDVA